MSRPILTVLGGSWHDFAGFGSWLSSSAYTGSFEFELTSDLARLLHLHASDPELLMLFNCIDDQSRCVYSDGELDVLERWVVQGGRLLALHSATVAAKREAKLRGLLGGAFVDHPAQRELLISPIGPPHPITSGVEPFRITDEMYRHELEPGLAVYLVAGTEREQQPIGWTRSRGKGTVAYLGLGHDAEAWRHPGFGVLMQQALSWLRGISGVVSLSR